MRNDQRARRRSIDEWLSAGTSRVTLCTAITHIRSHEQELPVRRVADVAGFLCLPVRQYIVHDDKKGLHVGITLHYH